MEICVGWSGGWCSVQGGTEKAVSLDQAHVITAPEKLQKWKTLAMLTGFKTFMNYQDNLVCTLVVSLQDFEASILRKGMVYF
jgi:hypothetical protein